MTIWQEIKHEFKFGNNLTKILFVNIAIYLIINLLQVFSWLIVGSSDSAISSFIITNIQTYINIPDLLRKPWTLITYMFTHLDFLHVLFNMLMLYWMGKIFVEFLNDKRFVAVYFVGGIFGAIFTVISYNIIPVLHSSISGPEPMIGASAAVMAVTVAIATYLPDYKIFLLFFGQVRLKYLALALVVLDVIFMSGSNSGGHLAHIGGAMYGFIWGSQLRKGNDISKWFMKIINFVADFFKPKPKMKFSKSKTESTYVNYQEKSKQSVSQKEIDAILDKIAKDGYDSLTAKEKEILFTMSKK